MKRSKKSLILILTMIIMMLAASFMMTACGNADMQGDDSSEIKTEQAADKEAANEHIDDETAAENKAADKKEADKPDVKSDKKDSKKDSKTESSKVTQPATQAATQAAVCYVSVEGYCSSKAITLQGGDTAYSVLKRTGAAVSAEGTDFGVYVNGINGRFASGDSGWKYSVNGAEPNTSSNNYSVKSGDTVKWYWGSAY